MQIADFAGDALLAWVVALGVVFAVAWIVFAIDEFAGMLQPRQRLAALVRRFGDLAQPPAPLNPTHINV